MDMELIKRASKIISILSHNKEAQEKIIRSGAIEIGDVKKLLNQNIICYFKINCIFVIIKIVAD